MKPNKLKKKDVKQMMKRFVFLVWLLCGAGALYAQQEGADVRAGNKLYEDGKFTEAEVEYRKGLQKKSDSFEANFNLGNALFRQEKYDEAMKYYANASAQTPADKKKLAAAYHNIGNSLLMSEKVAESIEAYKMALKNNPSDNDTRYNLAFAQQMLKQQQQQQQQNQDQQNQQNQQDQQKQQEQQKQEQQQDQQQQNQQDQQQDEQQQEQQQQPQAQEPQLSKENAQQILDALLEDEKDTQEKVKKQKARATRNVEKDW